MSLEKHDFLRRALRLLETPEITEEMAAAEPSNWYKRIGLSLLSTTSTALRLPPCKKTILPFHIAQQMKTAAEPYENLDHAILCEERKLRITLRRNSGKR